MDPATPIQRLFDLGDLSQAGREMTVTAASAELSRIAAWEGVDAVTLFEGRVTLKRLSQTRFLYSAVLSADVVQSCVVTLEPVRTHVARSFSRDLHYVPTRYDEEGGVLSLSAAEDEAPEDIHSLKFDLAGPLLEEFSLAIDPYPRAPGVEFELPPQETAKPRSPFAVLKALKRG